MSPILMLKELERPKSEVRWSCPICKVNMVNDPNKPCGSCEGLEARAA